MTLPEVGISLGSSVLLAILLLILAVSATIFFYRTTVPPVPSNTRIALASLRGITLALLFLLALEPLLKLLFHREQSPVLAVLLDDSESMTINDRGGQRSMLVREILERNPFEEIPADITFFRFSDQLNTDPLTHPDSLRFRGETTDLAASLADAAGLRERENIRAAVIVTDGEYTVGRNPLALTDDLGFPLYAVGVGDTTEQRDVLVARVTTNKIVYAETLVPVDVRLHSSGFRGATVDVVLSHGGAVIDHKLLRLPEKTGDYSVSLNYRPEEEGTQKYTVSVSPLLGELTERNNHSTFFVNVLKTKLRILLLAGAPSPDVTTVRQILLEDQHFSVEALVQKSAHEFYGGTLTPAVIDSADCIVLVGFPSTATLPEQIQNLRETVLRKKKPLLFVASRTLDFDKLRSLESLLPFTWTSPSTEEVLVFPYVPEKSRSHGLVNLGERISAESWGQLPPVYKTATLFRAKAEADVPAFATIRAVVLNEPLIALRNVARLRSFAMTGHGIWRWRLLAQGHPQTEQLLPLLLTNAVRWLTAPDEGKRVRVGPTKEAFTSADAVEFTGEVYDEQLRPLDNADLSIEMTSREGTSKFETILRSVGSGRYEGGMGGLTPGDYTFLATARTEGSVAGEDRGRFSIGQLNVEFLETRMNRPLLEQLAFRTGGLYADVAHVQSLVDSIRSRTPFVPREIVTTHEVELWSWQYIAGLIVLLLSTEWIIRKRNGML